MHLTVLGELFSEKKNILPFYIDIVLDKKSEYWSEFI